jgi:hypothetical protein
LKHAALKNHGFFEMPMRCDDSHAGFNVREIPIAKHFHYYRNG